MAWNVFEYFRACRLRRQQVVRDAEDFIAAYGESAYEEARELAREIRSGRVVDNDRPDGHWDRVRAKISRLTNRQYVDTATRWLES